MSLDLPDKPGTYVLELLLESDCEIQVGRHGRAQFPAGWYYYTGSALKGLRSRIGRHIRLEKPRHWHVDGLREHAEIVLVLFTETTVRIECSIAISILAGPGAFQPYPRFGSSDCRCPTHLVGFTHRPEFSLGSGWSHWMPFPATRPVNER